MKPVFFAPALIALLAVPLGAQAVVLYDSLSPGSSYNDGTGFGLGYPGPSSLAIAFTPGTSGLLSEIDVGITHISGANVLKLQLRADAAGLPGGVLQTWTLTGLPQFGTVHTIQAAQTLGVAPGVALTGGTRYWLAALPGNAPSEDVWNMDNYPTSSTATKNYSAQSFDGGVHWSSPGLSDSGGALRILGVVPEVGTAWMWAFGLAGVLLSGRRRSAG